ncbi:MAG: type II toxin-antitoxin system HicA family toxin [Candidatus Bipolaricaulota bacterium]|nr:type II toxin-antitoxin system HicA family toxin [Candidatus Bipolaricaulota bacterium]
MKFSEVVRLLEMNGFRIVKEKGSIRYYGKPGWPRLIRADYLGQRECLPAHATAFCGRQD